MEYTPPAFDSDEPLDAVEEALVRALVPVIAAGIRAWMDEQNERTPIDADTTTA